MATSGARNINEGNGATVEALRTQKQRGKTHRTGNRTKRKGTQDPETEQTANNAGRGGGSDNHTKKAQKNSVSKVIVRDAGTFFNRQEGGNPGKRVNFAA